MSVERRRNVSYLLRLWQIESSGRLVWRMSVEDAQSGERQGFTNLDELLAFLRRQTLSKENESDHPSTSSS